MIGLLTERQVIEGYKRAIIDKMPFADSADANRATRTLRYLNRQINAIGRDFREVARW